MNIMVTGGAGFVGSHACDALIARGDRVVAVDNFDASYAASVKFANLARVLENDRFLLVEGDIRSADFLADVFSGNPPFDVVVHLGAKAGIRASMSDPGAFIESNIGGTANLFEAMAMGGCRRLVFASSSSVYGNNRGRASHEDDPLNPLSIYAMTKAAGEDLCRVYHAARGFSVLCLRFFTVYGPRQRPEMAIHKFTRRLLKGEPIPVFGDGSMARDYTYVDDTIEGVTAAVDRVAVEDELLTLNIGSGAPVSLDGLVARLGRLVQIEPELDYRPTPKGDVGRTHADLGRVRELLGYEPSIDIETGLQRFIDWYHSAAKADLLLR